MHDQVIIRFKFPWWGVFSPSSNFRSSSLHPLPVQ